MWISGTVFLLIGIHKMYLAIKQYVSIQSEKNSLLQAIANQNQDYVSLYYHAKANEYIQHIKLYTNDNQLRIYSKKVDYEKILGYLGEKFPKVAEANLRMSSN